MDEKDIEVLSEIFVTRKECAATVEVENEKITNLKVEITKVGTKLGILIAILSAIAVPVISLCIKLLFGG